MLGIWVCFVLFALAASISFFFMSVCIKNQNIIDPKHLDKIFAVCELSIVGLLLLALIIGCAQGY